MKKLLAFCLVFATACLSNVESMGYYPSVINSGVNERTALLTYATNRPREFDASVRLLIDELEQKLASTSKHDSEMARQVVELRTMYAELNDKFNKQKSSFVKKTIKVLIVVALIGIAAQLVYTGVNAYNVYNKKIYPDKGFLSVFDFQLAHDVKSEAASVKDKTVEIKDGIVSWWNGDDLGPISGN